MAVITVEERQKVTQIIQERVEQLTFPELKNLSNEKKREVLNNIEYTIRKYLINLELISREINNATTNYTFSDGNQSKSLQLYILYKKIMPLNITQILQDGYILIENLRKTFTGKEIEYEIGMEYSVKRNQKVLINKKISLAELLSYAKVDIQWGATGLAAFKLRASSNKEDFNAEYQKQRIILENQITNLNSLYPKIYNILNQENISINKGNVYETYKHLRYEGYKDHPPGPKNPQNLSADDIVVKYMEIRKGIQSFVSGGDYDLTQFKLLSSAPSIASLITISKALKMMLNYIQKGQNNSVIIQNIQKNIFSKEFDNISKQAANEILDAVDESLLPFLSSK